ncbi:bifunctional phosphopantothenoylcysteine decarboxylase/phosphopantothenate--cysteine ligase CoaBC, partial [bacterium]|nr:bifunctional phosphopantothenoylcysteine decarboxylase/phosphopantothenate--cysteine ligase CoaBC [bacterium]
GPGRMAEVSKVLSTIEKNIGRNSKPSNLPLIGISVLVTAGPTQEKIDAVRYLTNYSSGKMGYAIAKHCQKLGADVCLISGPTSISPPEKVRIVNVKSAEEMYNAVMENAANSRLIIKSAAVSDFRVEEPNPQKTKKTESLTLKLVKNKDILKELGKIKNEKQFLVGFAAESQNVENYARQKLKEKNLDLIVANNILQKDAGFDVDTNRVLLIDEESETQLPLLSKEEVAVQILDHILAQKKWTATSKTTQKCEL